MKRLIYFLIIIICCSSPALSEIPRIINYQGRLMGSSGKPVPDGNYDITFRLYRESNNLVWTEDHNQVFVANGLFHVLLGTVTSLGIPFDKPYLLGMQIGGDPELQPRIVLTSSAYAIRAEEADKLLGISVNATPRPNTLLPLDNSGKFPASVIPGGSGTGDFLKKNGPDSTIGISTYPMLGVSNVGNGIGIIGMSAKNDGVTGWTGDSGKSGVYGWSQDGIGVTGHSNNDNGIVGWSGNSKKSGVYGHNEMSNGTGVHGFCQEGVGVYGESGNMGIGIEGISNAGFGVFGQSINGDGVYGSGSKGSGIKGYSQYNDGIVGCSGTSGKSGVYGYSEEHNGIGVRGYCPQGYGVYGETSDQGYGIYGTSPNGCGVYGSSSINVGILGESSDMFGALAAKNYGAAVLGYTNSNSYYLAGYFHGNVDISGTLSKSSGAFKIDHPLDPANKYLYHSFIESPDMKNIYDGVIILDGGGEAVVELPAYFEALNQDFRYQLTCIGSSAPVYIAKEISNNRFTISGGAAGLKVSWQVTGIRHDAYAQAHRIQVEVEKTGKESGKYIHPKEYGLQENLGIDFERKNKIQTNVKNLKGPQKPEQNFNKVQ